MKKILFIFGTRPEAIKMAPLIETVRKEKDAFQPVVCVTAQHRQMLDQVLDFFRIKPDYDLNLMKPNQSLFDVTADSLKGLEKVLDKTSPDLVITQGDTTTAFVGMLAAYYKKIPAAHLEAGLRSGNPYSPFPEELNRVLAGHIAELHFAPTPQAEENLRKENIREGIHVVGNTVIDALFLGLDIIKKEGENKYRDRFRFLDPNKKTILVTGHRRESFGDPIRNICEALKEITASEPGAQIVYPVHLNPNIRKPVHDILGGSKDIHLIEPLDYPFLLWLMKESYFVLTDSGGIQEEAPSLGKPVLVMRDVTERMEGVTAGTAKLVGTDKDTIVRESLKLLRDSTEYDRIARAVNPYGDGKTSGRIVEILKKREWR